MFFMFSKRFSVLRLNVSPGEEPFLLHSVYLNTIHSTELDNFIIVTDSYYPQWPAEERQLLTRLRVSLRIVCSVGFKWSVC